MSEELVPQSEVLPMENSDAGMVGLKNVQLPILTHDWTTKLFSCRLFGENLRSFNFNLVRYYDSGRRNYESKFEQGQEAKPPTCYSLDGETGSRSREFKELVIANKDKTSGTPMQVPCYGECASCHFAQYGTSLIWTGSPVLYRPGPNCSQYGIAFVIWHREVLDPEDMRPTGEIIPVPAIVHVPPTGTGPVRQAFQMVRAQFNRSPQQFMWKAMPSGGGKKKEAMVVINQKLVTPEQYQAVRNFENSFDQFMQNYRVRMLSGRVDSTKDSVSAGDEVPFDENQVA